MLCLLPFEAGVHDVEWSGIDDLSGVPTQVCGAEEEDKVSWVEMWGLLSGCGDSVPNSKLPMNGLGVVEGELRAGVGSGS